MAQKTENKPKETYREVQAHVIAALQTTLESGEALLGFTRGRVSGGWKGKLSVGVEALFAPDVNIGLTDRRLVLQHVTATSGKPSQILPHTFPLEKLSRIQFSEIETFGGETEGRLVIRETDETTLRLRLTGKEFCRDAQTLAEVFKSLLQAQQKSTVHPTSPPCPSCGRALSQPARFCPYCGSKVRENDVETATENVVVPDIPISASVEVAPEPFSPDLPEEIVSSVKPDSPSASVEEPSFVPIFSTASEPHIVPDAFAISAEEPVVRNADLNTPLDFVLANAEPEAKAEDGLVTDADNEAVASLESKTETSAEVENKDEDKPKKNDKDEFWRDFARISGVTPPD